MNASREGLLQPSLTDAAPSAAPYTIRTTFLAGFFGGPFGALAILVVNSARLRRVRRDLPVWLGALVLFVVGAWALHRTALGGDAVAWIKAQLGDNGVRHVYRLAALAIVGIGFLLHRQEQRNSDLLDLERPNGWVGGLACIAAGIVLLGAFVAVIMR